MGHDDGGLCRCWFDRLPATKAARGSLLVSDSMGRGIESAHAATPVDAPFAASARRRSRPFWTRLCARSRHHSNPGDGFVQSAVGLVGGPAIVQSALAEASV